mmetsp:Transcript_37672/g.113708  ORF Transcript_37672/g.113708 Transcript_37672/m.113708 type:complete len:296 (-) Transcript_37672:31-918(-)
MCNQSRQPGSRGSHGRAARLLLLPVARPMLSLTPAIAVLSSCRACAHCRRPCAVALNALAHAIFSAVLSAKRQTVTRAMPPLCSVVAACGFSMPPPHMPTPTGVGIEPRPRSMARLRASGSTVMRSSQGEIGARWKVAGVALWEVTSTYSRDASSSGAPLADSSAYTRSTPFLSSVHRRSPSIVSTPVFRIEVGAIRPATSRAKDGTDAIHEPAARGVEALAAAGAAPAADTSPCGGVAASLRRRATAAATSAAVGGASAASAVACRSCLAVRAVARSVARSSRCTYSCLSFCPD